MANLQGTTKTTERVLLTGPAFLIPIAVNPTNDRLSLLTNKKINRNAPPVYEFTYTDSQGQERTIKKAEIWLKVPYHLDENNEIVQSKDPNLNTLETFVKLSFPLSAAPDENANGAWYVSSNTCEMEWVKNGQSLKRLDATAPHVHKAQKGEKELYNFISTWLNLKEVGIETPFADLLQGNWTEFNDICTENLNRTDRTPRGFIGLLCIKGDSDNNYQEVYSKKFLIEENKYPQNLAKNAAGDSYFTANNEFSNNFMEYNPIIASDVNISITPTALPNATSW